MKFTPLPKVKLPQGTSDFIHWGRNARAHLMRHDPILIGLKPEATGPSAAARTAQEKANAIAKGTITLVPSEHVQFGAVAYCDDNYKTAYDFGNFLESAYTASNEQTIQNIRLKLDSLVYNERAKWDDHLNQFDGFIAQLAM